MSSVLKKADKLNLSLSLLASNALDPCVAKSSATMLLTMQDKQVVVFHKEGFQLHATSQCLEMMRNANIFLWFIE